MVTQRLFAVMCITVLLLTGCGRKEASSGADAPSKVKVVYWRHYFPPEDAAVKQLIAKFERGNPDVDVVYQSMPFKGYREKLDTSLNAKTGPNVINIHNSWAYGAIRSGHLVAMPADTHGPEKIAKTFVPLVQSFMDSGKCYGLPIGGGCLALFVNNAYLKAAGYGPSDLPKDWKTLEQMALKMTKKAGDRIERTGFACGGIESQSWNYLVEGLFRQNGSGVIAKDNKRVLWDGPEGIAAFEWYLSFVTKHRIFDLSFEKPMNIFAQGRAAMIVDGNWIVKKLGETAPDLDYTVCPLPAGKTKATYGSCWGNCVTIVGTSAQQKAAARFISFITSREAARFWTGAVGELPMYRDVLADPAFMKAHAGLKPFIDSMAYAYSSLKKDETRYKTAVTTAIEKVILKGVESSAALKEAAEEVNAMLNK